MPEQNIVSLSKTSAYVGERKGVDTVVFVHGIAGSFHDTWGMFPDLMATDPDLPEMDILLWGYRTTLLPADVHDTATIGRHLISELRGGRLESDASAHLVAHSMGGLIVFQALVDEMRQGRAQEPPISQIQHLSLFAVPTRGSVVAATAAQWTSAIGLPGALNRQIRSLGTAQCDQLIAQVTQRIYRPAADGAEARRIPIRMVFASNDSVVGNRNANMTQAPFTDPAPLEFPFGHRDLKLPDSRRDVRYLALASDVQELVTRRFAELARAILNGNDDQREKAKMDLEFRYGNLLRLRFTKAGGDPHQDPNDYWAYCNLVMRDCLTPGRRVCESANRVVVVLARRGYFGRRD